MQQNASKAIRSVLSLYVFLNWPRDLFFLDLVNSIFPWLKNKSYLTTDKSQKITLLVTTALAVMF